VIFVKDMLFAVLALVSVVIAAGSFYFYVNRGGQTIYIVAAILFVILTVVLGGLFLSGRVNKNDDIHITE
jgi:uncharacterized membrane protein